MVSLDCSSAPDFQRRAPRDWYLQHLELITIVPALVVGYFNVFRFAHMWLGEPKEGNQSGNMALWSCALPSLSTLLQTTYVPNSGISLV
jgi:hypothetical protein